MDESTTNSLILHELMKQCLRASEDSAKQIGEISTNFARLDERLRGFVDHADERADKHSKRLDEATRDAARAAARLQKLEVMIEGFLAAAEKQTVEHSAHIAKAAADANAANVRLDKWQSKIDLVVYVAGVVGLSGVANIVAALTRGAK